MLPEFPGEEFFVTVRNMMELTNTHETTYLGCETKSGLCKNECATTTVCQDIYPNWERTPISLCPRKLRASHPPQSPTLKPCGTCDTHVFPEHWDGALLSTPPSPVGIFSKLHEPLQLSGYNTLRAFSMLPAQVGGVEWGGVKVTGWGESPSALGAGQALISQLFSKWAHWCHIGAQQRARERYGGEAVMPIM